MPYNPTSNTWELSDVMVKLQDEKKAGYELQKRKHEDWTDNYELFRNKVKTNRLTQRQAVNIPLMKETIKRLLSSIDDRPNVEWSEIGGDEYKKLVMQEIWNEHMRINNLELIDILDKKNVLLYGISAKKLNIDQQGVSCSVLDPYDLYIDPLTNSWDLSSARYLVHNNIFKTVRDILANEKYSKEGKEQIKVWVNTPQGIQQSEEARKEWEKKMERMKSMGISHGQFSYFAGGDMLVNLTEHFYLWWNGKEFEKRVCVYADNKIELYNETLMDTLGVDFWPFVIWSEDVETQDVYPDSVADLVRTPNKVLNVWYSQLIENRTLKNFQMHWVSATGSYSPQTFTPGPGMQLPAPPLSSTGKISDVIQPVEISGLDDTLEAINILTQIVERGSGVTALQKGGTEEGVQTLGEVQILLGQATERVTAMAKFYRLAWEQYVYKWYELLSANAPKMLKLSKQGKSGKLYEKRIMAGDWKSEFGYKGKVTSSSEQEQNDVKTMQKWMFVTSKHPNNVALQKLAMKRELDLLDVTPEELKQVEEAEDQAQIMMQQGVQQPGQPSPEEAQLGQQIQQQMAQLNVT